MRSDAIKKALWSLSAIGVGLTVVLTTVPCHAQKVTAVTDAQLALLRKLDGKFQKQSAKMTVKRTVKESLLNRTRTESGTLWVSAGRLRLELEGDHKSVLVVNKKKLWAITFPPREFQDAKVQVITGNTESSKTQTQGLLTLLSRGGFLKFFVASGAQGQTDGSTLYFLSPKELQASFRRAVLKISSRAELLDLDYWDDRENETEMAFLPQAAGKLEDSLFSYEPPKNADVMNL